MQTLLDQYKENIKTREKKFTIQLLKPNEVPKLIK